MIGNRLKALLGLEQDADEKADRRLFPRRKVLLMGEVFPVNGFAQVVVKNVSRTGLAGETHATLQTNRSLLFSLEGNHFHLGTVRWVRGGRFGMDLSDALGILGFENEVDGGSGEAQQPRARRYDVDVPGKVALASQSLPVTVRDVSQTGLCLETPMPLPERQQVIIRLRDRPLILGSVQWVIGNRIGVKTVERMETLRLVYAYE